MMQGPEASSSDLSGIVAICEVDIEGKERMIVNTLQRMGAIRCDLGA